MTDPLITRMEQGGRSPMTDLPSDLVEIAAREIRAALSAKDPILDTLYDHELEAAARAVLSLPTLRAQYRREGLEEAAGVCDGLHRHWYDRRATTRGDEAGWLEGQAVGAKECAEAIRSLKDTGPVTGET